jgi:hypothetical protein
MNDKQESKKKKMVDAETPVHTIRAGAVAASIWRRQSPSGYVYFDYSLARSFKSLSSGNTGYSKNFFARNQQELVKVIEQASQWIVEHEQRQLVAEPLAA